MSYTSRSVTGRSGRSRTPAAPAPKPIPKPGVFAPKGEKKMYEAVKDGLDLDLLRPIATSEPNYRYLATTLAGLKLAGSPGSTDKAQACLNEVFAAGYEPEHDPFVLKYLPNISITIGITAEILAELPLSRDLIGLALAEVCQVNGDLESAIDVVEQVEPSTYAAVSLAELYSLSEAPDKVIELTNNLTNHDDFSVALLIFRGIALGSKGYFDAALQAFKESLRFKDRSTELKQLALFERAKLQLNNGKKSLAKRDLEKLMGENSNYDGIESLLSLASSN